MRHVLRAIFFLALCAQVLGCPLGSRTTYPAEWPKIRESSFSGCGNISGEYSDLDTTRKISLAGLFLLHRGGGSKILHEASHTVIVHADKTIEVKVKKHQETLKTITATVGEDFKCSKGGLHTSKIEFAAQEGAMGGGEETFAILMSEDGSLIVHRESRGCVCYILPWVLNASEYYRFERYVAE